MNISLNLSYIPDNLFQLIINSDNLKNFIIKNNLKNGQPRDSKIIVLDYPGSIIDLENLLNIALQKFSNNEYVAVQDIEKENTLTLLRNGDIEQLGIYICDLCGAVFHGEDEKYVHQRAHFLF